MPTSLRTAARPLETRPGGARPGGRWGRRLRRVLAEVAGVVLFGDLCS